MTPNKRNLKTHVPHADEQPSRPEADSIAKGKKSAIATACCDRSQELRRPGIWRGKVQIAEEFDELPKNLASAFRGEKS
jgi:hypothetical protein